MLRRDDRALFATYVRPQWPRATLLGVLLLSGIVLQLASPQIARTFIDDARAGESLERLTWLALAFLGVALATLLASLAEIYVAEDLGWRATNALRLDLARHVLGLDAAFHSEHGAGELIERIDGDVSSMAEFFSRFVVQVIGSGLFLLGALVLLWTADWRIGGLLTLFALLALIFMTRRGDFVGIRSRGARAAEADLSAFLEEQLGGLPDIKSSGADDYAMLRLHQRLAARFHRARGAAIAGSAFNCVVGVIFVLGTGGALVWSVVLYGAGAISLGTIYLVFRYTSMLRETLERLSRQMSSFQQATGGIVRVRDLFATRASIGDGRGTALPPGPLSVEFDAISFDYGAEPVLRDVSFKLEPTEVLGLLGRTGSGKTTVARLLVRLYEPVAGHVRLGGVDIRDVRLDHLGSRVGLVTQDVQLFQGTLRENVALFDRSVPDRRLAEVFDILGLDAWLATLPEGLDTPLGAGGRGLSAGEAQLVALARVFLKDPGLVILDEASSRLDPATERLLERAVSRLLEGRTGVVIAHRLATVQRADRVLILDDGQVAELGRPSELAEDPSSRYSRLLRAGMAEVLA